MLPRDHYLKQSFHDAVNFPAGFEKGGLSDIQARLVRKHGALISALTRDEVSDPNSDDLHLLKVIASQSAPKNPIEQAWVKYLSIVKARQSETPKTKAKTKSATPKVAPAESDAAVEPASEAPVAKPVTAKTAKSSKETAEKPATKKAAPSKKTAVDADEKPAKATRAKATKESSESTKAKPVKKAKSAANS